MAKPWVKLGKLQLQKKNSLLFALCSLLFALWKKQSFKVI